MRLVKIYGKKEDKGNGINSDGSYKEVVDGMDV